VTARAGRSAPRSPGATLRGPRSYTTTRGTTYSKGRSSKDLGSVLQFESGLEVAYQLDLGRIGGQISHMSNAGIYEDNPEVELVLLTYSLPLDFF